MMQNKIMNHEMFKNVKFNYILLFFFNKKFKKNLTCIEPIMLIVENICQLQK